MKVTIAPTEVVSGGESEILDPRCINATITVDVPTDDLTLANVFETLIGPALKAFGFLSESVEDCIDAAVGAAEKNRKREG